MTTSRRVVVTRPEPDAAPFADDLRAVGFTPVIAPLMSIEILDGPAPATDGVQAVAFTSANGVRAYLARGGSTALPAFAVGPASAAACLAGRFTRVVDAGGDVDRLGETLLGALRPEDGAVFHAAGRTLAGDLVARLEAGGLWARRETLYEARAVETLPGTFAAALAERPGPVISLFSPRTARLAVRLIAAAGLSDAAGRAVALCLSPAVAEAAREMRWSAVWLAPEANTPSIMTCLQSCGASA